MAKNPSTSKCYSKLIRSCKYFFEKNPVVVAADLYCETKICSNKDCDGDEKCCISIDINKVTSKIWLTAGLILNCEHVSNYASLLYQKLYRYEMVRLDLCNQHIIYDEFKHLASCAKSILLINVQITYNDGSVVTLETILGSIPNVENFQYHSEDNRAVITSSTFANILKLKNLNDLNSFHLSNIVETVTVKSLSMFLENHKGTKIYLEFDDSISEEYKLQLDSLVNTVIECETAQHFIVYDGQDDDKYEIMDDRYYNFDE
uniref:Uncharacterized protein n=1 Tax=Panagrolaimus superbus TaxID=310955 RepID=A0A914XYV4_9BILA